MGTELVIPQAVVDDVTIFAVSLRRVIREADRLLEHWGRMNLVINADTFALLHCRQGRTGMRCVPGRHQIGGYTVEARCNGEYVRLLGGDVN